MRLLFVEDELSLLRITSKRLQAEGYSVDECSDGLDALDYIEMADYDAIILDIMLPGLDGLSVLKAIRKSGKSTPVLLLTAKDTVSDRVQGLDCGADDYLIKPFAYDELSARLRALMRRPAADSVSNTLKFEDLEMDLSTHTVTRSGQKIQLSKKEFSILEYLLRNKNIVLSRDNIEQHVWNYDFEGESNVIDVYIRCIRKKIDSGFDAKLIHTVRGVGYVLRKDA